MQVNDVTLEVRDRTLKRVGQVTSVYLNMKARTRWCGVGEWTLTLPGDHPMVPYLSTPGAGIILLGPDGTDVQTILSGPVETPTKVRNAQNPDGTFTFNGVTDEVHLARAEAFPDPSIADPQLSSRSRSNDTRSGTTESLLRQYVAYNIANGAHTGVTWAPEGRLRGLRSKITLRGAAAAGGLAQVKSPRFQNLLELLQEIVAYDPAYGFRMVQIDGLIQFEVLQSRDRSKFIRFDVENGTLLSEEVATSGAALTDVFVLGQGEGKERTIVRRQTAASIASENAWGIVSERSIDQRDKADVGELQQAGDEALLEGQGGTSVKIVPADDTTMKVGVDWRQGDQVTTVVSGVETVSRVTEVAYLLDSSGVRAGAALGDVSGFSQQDRQAVTVKSLDSRVANLERTGGLLPARLGLTASMMPNVDDLVESGTYWLSSGSPNNPDGVSHFAVEVLALSNGSIYQEARRFVGGGYAYDHYTRNRASGTWTAWKPLGLATKNYAPTILGSTNQVGNGTLTGSYSVSDGMLTGRITWVLGSTSVVGADLQFSHGPLPYSGSTRTAGIARLTDSSASIIHQAVVLTNSSAVYVRPMGVTAAASGELYSREYSMLASRPFPWAAGDNIVAEFSYPLN